MSRPNCLWRWTAVFAQSVAAGVFAFGLIQAASPSFERFVIAMARLGDFGLSLFIVTLIAMSVTAWAKGRIRAAIGLGQFLVVPPFWVSMGLATVVACQLCNLSHNSILPEPPATMLFAALLGSSILAGIAFAMAIDPGFYTEKSKKYDSEKVISNDIHNLSASPKGSRVLINDWLDSDDAPISEVAFDLLDHRTIAARILVRLAGLDQDIDIEPTIVLRGPHGSGKTSILNLVRGFCVEPQALPKHAFGASGTFPSQSGNIVIRPLPTANALQRLRIVHISAWSFLSEESLISGVIKEVSEAIHREVDALPLTGVPRQYTEAIGRGGGILADISSILNSLPRTARDIVATLGDYLVAIDIQVVVWIDDLDRLRTSSDHAGADIMSLLDLFRATRGISFVLAISDSSSLTFDYNRIATYVEELPSIEMELCLRIVNQFQEEQLSAYADIHPREPDTLGVSLFVVDQNRPLGESVIPREAAALATVLNRPRALKSALRRCRAAWRALHGEVSFRDLLLDCALFESTATIVGPGTGGAEKAREVRVYDAVRDARNVLGRGQLLGPRSHELRAWEDALSSGNASECDIIATLVNDMKIVTLASSDNLQRVSSCGVTDYLGRIRTLVNVEKPRDQEVMRAMRSLVQPDKSSSEMLERIVSWIWDGGFAERKVIQFAPHMLLGTPMIKVADKVISMALQIDARDYAKRMEWERAVACVATLGSLVTTRTVSRDGITGNVVRWIREAVERDLGIASRLVVDFERQLSDSGKLGSQDGRGPSFLREAQRLMLEYARSEGRAEWVRRAVPVADVWCLNLLMRHSWASCEQMPDASWSEIGRAFDDAVSPESPHVAAALALLVCSRTEGYIQPEGRRDPGSERDPLSPSRILQEAGYPRFEFDDPIAEKLWGAERERVLQRIAYGAGRMFDDTEAYGAVEAIRQHIRAGEARLL